MTAAIPLKRFLLDAGSPAAPEAVWTKARRALLDTIGTAAAGATLPVSKIARNHAADHMASITHAVRMLFDGREASPAGAAFAGATTIDAFDAHDGHVLTKGHIGVSVLPTLLALAELGLLRDGRDFLGSLILGYEIGTRAGIALHDTAADYHTSGAWGAVACAALVSRHLRLNWRRTREALGIAEYHGPRSQMMRCIAWPTMVKDGSGWGAFSGVTAGFLAQDGYTGAPAVTIEAPEVAAFWSDLGSRWRLLEQYEKAYPVCRWAQPAVEAVAALKRAHGFTADQIAALEIHSFANAVALNVRAPDSPDAAQYSLPFPVAAYLVRGRLGAAELAGKALKDKEILDLSTRMTLIDAPEFSAKFPAERWARAVVTLADGRRLTSDPAIARGNPENPLSEAEALEKYRDLAGPVLGPRRASAIEKEVAALGRENRPLQPRLDLLLRPAR